MPSLCRIDARAALPDSCACDIGMTSPDPIGKDRPAAFFRRLGESHASDPPVTQNILFGDDSGTDVKPATDARLPRCRGLDRSRGGRQRHRWHHRNRNSHAHHCSTRARGGRRAEETPHVVMDLLPHPLVGSAASPISSLPDPLCTSSLSHIQDDTDRPSTKRPTVCPASALPGE
jgi:hypothetical protein